MVQQKRAGIGQHLRPPAPTFTARSRDAGQKARAHKTGSQPIQRILRANKTSIKPH